MKKRLPSTNAIEAYAGLVGRRWQARCSALLALFLLLSPTAALAWGREGHRVSGLIANELLTLRSRAGLRALLGSDDLTLAATWADDYRAPLGLAYPGSASWHFDDIPICDKPSFAAICPDGNCASAQIVHFLQVARDSKVSREKRADAVRFIVHLVGDLQQPLHAADNGDRGGNDVQLDIPGMSQPAKLHYAWDTLFVRTSLRGRSEGEFAQYLLGRYRRKIQSMQAGDLNSWLAESHRMASAVVYDGLEGALHCPMQSAGKHYTVNAAYVERATDIVQGQLVKAGARIAVLMNSLFASP